MAIQVYGIDFQGPFTRTESIQDNSGLYVILDHRPDGTYWVLDVGESSGLKTRLENHERSRCWGIHAKGTVKAVVLYTPAWTANQRRDLETKVRGQYAPTCGVR